MRLLGFLIMVLVLQGVVLAAVVLSRITPRVIRISHPPLAAIHCTLCNSTDLSAHEFYLGVWQCNTCGITFDAFTREVIGVGVNL